MNNVLRHLQENKCYQVKCVVWCVMPTPRMNSVLQEQANYIHQFITDDENTTENEAGRIWNNVLIVCKGKVNCCCLSSRNQKLFCQLSPKLEGDVQGAVLAAKDKFVHAEPRAIRSEQLLVK